MGQRKGQVGRQIEHDEVVQGSELGQCRLLPRPVERHQAGLCRLRFGHARQE